MIRTGDSAASQLTDERMVPRRAAADEFWAHIMRYRFARRYIHNKSVLDVACGEGYGADGLAKGGARSVIAIDISEEACSHARQNYGVDARVGDASALDVADNSVDVVVSFETIEHLVDPAKFVAECQRVLVANGTLVISTPNREVYHRFCMGRSVNPYHCSEMPADEFSALLQSYFADVAMFSQLPNPSIMSYHVLYGRNRAWRRAARYLLRRRLPLLRNKWMVAALRGASGLPVNDARFRQQPYIAICAEDSWWTRCFSPFAIRKLRSVEREKPAFLIAVAKCGEELLQRPRTP